MTITPPLADHEIDRRSSIERHRHWHRAVLMCLGLDLEQRAVERGKALRRRQTTFGLLIGASVLSAILIVFVPPVGIPLTTIVVLALGGDLALLARRQQHATERAMTAAFRSPRTLRQGQNGAGHVG